MRASRRSRPSCGRRRGRRRRWRRWWRRTRCGRRSRPGGAAASRWRRGTPGRSARWRRRSRGSTRTRRRQKRTRLRALARLAEAMEGALAAPGRAERAAGAAAGAGGAGRARGAAAGGGRGGGGGAQGRALLAVLAAAERARGRAAPAAARRGRAAGGRGGRRRAWSCGASGCRDGWALRITGPDVTERAGGGGDGLDRAACSGRRERTQCGPVVDRADVVVGPAEVVGDLVHQHVAHQPVEADVAAVDPFLEDRAAVEPDGVGRGRLVEDRALGQRGAVVEAGQLVGVLDPHLVEDVVGRRSRRPGSTRPSQARRTSAGSAGEGAAGERLEVARARGRRWRRGPRACPPAYPRAAARGRGSGSLALTRPAQPL